MTFIVVPDGAGGLRTRSFEVSYRRLKLGAFLALIAIVLWVGMAASWGYVAARAARVPGLERQAARMEQERQRVVLLAQSLSQLERQYARVRTMLGADLAPDRTVPAESGAVAGVAMDASANPASLPTLWPLRGRGFVTREHLGQIPGRHPGIDIAIPEGSPILAAGAGTVLGAGEDSIYGQFVRIRHGNGYETTYAHASRLLVQPRDAVQRGQVIALSGNTGRSTAPHLHFEIRQAGQPVDPRKLVRPPARN